MNRISGYVITTLLAFSLLGCDLMLLDEDPPANAESVFEHLWEDLNRRYAFFELKGVDWDEMYERFKAEIHPEIEDENLFEVLSDMLYELQDGHVNLTSDVFNSRTWEWYRDFPSNYSEITILAHYLAMGREHTGPLRFSKRREVLYVDYRSFADVLTDRDLDSLANLAQGMKGVILDIRNNGGGNLSNAYKLASCFAPVRTEFARQRWKRGPGRDDFSDWTSMYIGPRTGSVFAGPVIVLTNRRSYSASSFFAQMMRSLPHVRLLGDRTGGGGGTPAFGELPNGWIYRFSSTQTIDLEGLQMEEGVPVDYEVRMRRNDEISGRDTLIEEAIRLLEQGF